jgi:tetratricopeptide (TPR) repeat protein
MRIGRWTVFVSRLDKTGAELEKCRMELEKCRMEVSREPDSVPANLGLANSLLQADQFEEAIQVCERIMHLQPDDTQLAAIAHLLMGFALDGMGRRSEARQQWEQALALDEHGIGKGVRRMLRNYPLV